MKDQTKENIEAVNAKVNSESETKIEQAFEVTEEALNEMSVGGGIGIIIGRPPRATCGDYNL